MLPLQLSLVCKRLTEINNQITVEDILEEYGETLAKQVEDKFGRFLTQLEESPRYVESTMEDFCTGLDSCWVDPELIKRYRFDKDYWPSIDFRYMTCQLHPDQWDGHFEICAIRPMSNPVALGIKMVPF